MTFNTKNTHIKVIVQPKSNLSMSENKRNNLQSYTYIVSFF